MNTAQNEYCAPPAQAAAESLTVRLYVIHQHLHDTLPCAALVQDAALVEAAEEAVRAAHERVRWLAAQLDDAPTSHSLARRASTPQELTALLKENNRSNRYRRDKSAGDGR